MEIIQFLIFALIFMSFIGGAHYYIYLRLIRPLPLSKTMRLIYIGILGLLFLIIPIVMFSGRFFLRQDYFKISYMGLLWIGSAFFFTLIIGFVDLVKYIFSRIQSLFFKDDEPQDYARRKTLNVIATLGITAAVAGLTTVSAVNAARLPTVIKKRIYFEKFPSKYNGFKIVQISDLHVGMTVYPNWLKEVVEQVNQIKPDLIAITGDLVEGSVDLLKDEISPLNELKARDGIFFVTGNHEYYHHANQWIEHLKNMGIQTLRNEAVSLGCCEDTFYLAGVDDFQGSRFEKGHGPDLQKALEKTKGKGTILLCHQPKIIHEASKSGVDLVLSGHTHGGQVWPFNYLVRLQQPYNKGFFVHKNTQLYINQGTGLWGPPMRLGTTPEITELILQNGKHKA